MGESPRRLATILAADIAGYSRLLGMDEEGTLARVKRCRRELIEPTVAEHHGRLVKWMGDGFLADFDSPVEAVRCAVVIQQSMGGRNAALARPHWIQFRIGVNLGDIIVDSDDVFGEGVALASRLQGLAEPGGVYISGGVYELVKNKLVVGYQPLGDHRVKNITDPVRVYRVLPDPAAMRKLRHTRSAVVVLVVAVAALSAGAAILYSRQSSVTPGVPVAAQSAGQPMTRPPPPPEPAAQGADQRRIAVVTPPPRTAPAPVKRAEMVSLPGGSFMMGSNEDRSEKPLHRVTVRPFSIGRYLVTLGEWKDCVAAGACADLGGDDDRRPVINVSWTDAQKYAAWLARATNESYRLPSEAEWEYAARGGTDTKYWWGNHVALGMANCKGCGEPYDPHHPVRVGSFPPNPFGLYDMTGAVAEWVSDCWHPDYRGAPEDGSSWEGGDCPAHVLRGGSWQNDPSYLRAASRDQYDTGVRYITHGFRLARSQ